jgi:hypothetical protein
MLRHHAAALNLESRDGDALRRDELARNRRVDLFRWNVVPAMKCHDT